MCAECAADPGRFTGDSDVATIRALRVVFAAVIDRETAARCLGCDPDVAVALWPSSLYGLLAAAAARSPAVYCRCANAVATQLESALLRVNGLSPAELAKHFIEGRDVLSTEELAALVWALVERRERSLGFMVARLAAELEIAATRNGAARREARARGAEPRPPAKHLGFASRFFSAGSASRALPARIR
jgi:hypothetical protein